MPRRAKTFEVGDRVMLKSEKARKAFKAMTHGVVVHYRGEHDPRNPRVRWFSGWGVTSKASSLRVLTEEEASQLPLPRLCEIDAPPAEYKTNS